MFSSLFISWHGTDSFQHPNVNCQLYGNAAPTVYAIGHDGPLALYWPHSFLKTLSRKNLALIQLRIVDPLSWFFYFQRWYVRFHYHGFFYSQSRWLGACLSQIHQEILFLFTVRRYVRFFIGFYDHHDHLSNLWEFCKTTDSIFHMPFLKLLLVHV